MSIGHLLTLCSPLIVLSLLVSDAGACWLTNCLFGRPDPVMVGYPPVIGGTHVVGFAPVTGSQVVGTQIQTVQMPAFGSQMPAFGSQMPAFGSQMPAFGSQMPAFGSQMPAFGSQMPAFVDNPNVYTGLPIVNANRVPLAGSIRGLATTSNPFYGTGNQYPNRFGTANFPPAGTVMSGTAVAAAGGSFPVSSTVMPTHGAVPVVPVSPTPRRGLSRFFGGLLGTNYQSTYNPAPITYYRPVTTIDPVSGTTVTVQQPCTSTVQLLQQTPTRGFAGHTSATAPPVMASPLSNWPSPSTSFDGGASTFDSGSAYGSSPAYGTGSSSVGSSGTQVPFGDQSPVPPPQLPSARPSYESPSDGTYGSGFGGPNENGSTPDQSTLRNWDSNREGDSASGDRESGYNGEAGDNRESTYNGESGYDGENNPTGYQPLSPFTPSHRQPARPIPAPEGGDLSPYLNPSPGWERSLPASENRPADFSRSSAPVREASLTREAPPLPQQTAQQRPQTAQQRPQTAQQRPQAQQQRPLATQESGWYSPKDR